MPQISTKYCMQIPSIGKTYEFSPKDYPDQGKTPDNPICIPRDGALYGAALTIDNISEWFYDYDDRSKGGSHRYVDGFHVWISTLDVEAMYGDDSGWEVYTYEGTTPGSHIVINKPQIGSLALNYKTENNGYTLSIWIRRWQVRASGEWEWEWYRIWKEIVYVDGAPYFDIRPVPSGSSVYINDQHIGTSPLIYVPQPRFSGTKTFKIKITAAGRKPHEETKSVAWTRSPPVVTISPELQYAGCTDPVGDHGFETCRGYDRMICNINNWEIKEPDSPRCGFPPPVAKFSAVYPDASPPVTVTFIDESLNNPITWLWDFQDGTTSTEQNPVHTYTSPGVYRVTLEVTNRSGLGFTSGYVTINSPCTNPDSEHLGLRCVGYTLLRCRNGSWVPIEANSKRCGYSEPVASFTVSEMGSGTRTYRFEDTSTWSPTTWLWDFGDGATSTEQNPVHTYAEDGTYVVTLTVSNHLGSSTATSEITVSSVTVVTPPDTTPPGTTPPGTTPPDTTTPGTTPPDTTQTLNETVRITAIVGLAAAATGLGLYIASKAKRKKSS